eukprot:PhF_6_TR3670/c0_g1_i1/m.5176
MTSIKEKFNLYRLIHREGDDFFQQSRKILFVVSFFGGMFGVGYTLYDILCILLWPYGYADIGATISVGVVTFGLLIGFIVSYHTKTAPDALVELMMFCWNSGVILIMVSTRQMPFQPMFFAFAIGCVIMQCPRYWFHLPMCFIGYLLAFYEQSLTTIGYLPLVIGDTTNYTIIDVFIRGLICVFAMLIVLRAVHVQTQEFRGMLSASQMAVRMSLEIAEKLVAYDTTGATMVLDLYSLDGVIDSRLVDTFTQITHNLEAYRAFIPQALLEVGNEESSTIKLEASEKGEDSETRGLVDPNADSQVMPMENTFNGTNPDSTGTGMALSPLNQNMEGSTRSSMSPPVSPSGSGLRKRTYNFLDDPRVARLRQMGFKKFHITMMAVSGTLNGNGVSPSEIHEQCQNIVTTAVSVVEQCEGVVMHMHADRVYASWNAFKPC